MGVLKLINWVKSQDGGEWTGKHGNKRLIPHLKYGFIELQYMHTITSNYYVVSMFWLNRT